VSPNGKWIAFTQPRRRFDRLWIAHLDGTHVRPVTRKICCSSVNWQIEWAGK